MGIVSNIARDGGGRPREVFLAWLRTGRWPVEDIPAGIITEDPVETDGALRAWLRAGELPPAKAPLGTKFNPWHDPENGQFTFAGAGDYFGDGAGGGSAARGGARAGLGARIGASGARTPSSSLSDGVYRPDENGARLELVAGGSFRSPGRGGIGGNRGPALDPIQDPMTLEQTFPGLSGSPAGIVVALGDNALDITGPGRRVTADLNQAYSNMLIQQIRAIQPGYRYDSLGPPTTRDAWENQINTLRFDRAVALAREMGELGPMQVETLRAMQATADRAYDEGMILLRAGKLTPRLSPQETLGNYIDRKVRMELRGTYNRYGLDEARNPLIRVNRNERESSADERTFRRPDARVGGVAFDVTLTRKTLATPQVRGFFSADFKPDQVVIVRPRQLGSSSSYIITRPNSKHYTCYEVKMALDKIVATGERVYIPKTLSEIYDYFAILIGYAPFYQGMTNFGPYMNIDVVFEIVEEGFKIVREKVGEENHAKLMDLAARTKAFFAQAKDKDDDEVTQGIRLIEEMEDIVQAVRTARVEARLPDEEGRVTGD